jgi:hypothetical protein
MGLYDRGFFDIISGKSSWKYVLALPSPTEMIAMLLELYSHYLFSFLSYRVSSSTPYPQPENSPVHSLEILLTTRIAVHCRGHSYFLCPPNWYKSAIVLCSCLYSVLPRILCEN